MDLAGAKNCGNIKTNQTDSTGGMMKIQQYIDNAETIKNEIAVCKYLQQMYKDKQAFLEAELDILLKMNVGPINNGHIRN